MPAARLPVPQTRATLRLSELLPVRVGGMNRRSSGDHQMTRELGTHKQQRDRRHSSYSAPLCVVCWLLRCCRIRSRSWWVK
jgi:hypothetical protein